MTTAIYFNEMPTQRNAHGNSERTGNACRNRDNFRKKSET